VVCTVSDTEVGRPQSQPSKQQARSSWRWSGLPAARYVAVAILLVAAATWLVALPRLRAEPGGQYGLLATPGGALLLTAVTLAIIAFALSIAANRMFISGLSILAVIVLERLTVTLTTNVPIYTYTYQHIGVIDYIVRYRTLPLPKVDVYNQWPGFFAAMAWFSSVAHVDPVDVAHWFTPLLDAVTAVVVAALALALGFGMRVALTAAMLAQVLNWVGQDYYSPQALALLITIAMLALLAWSREYPAAGYLSVPMFAAVTATHQLTPVWLTALVLALAIFRQISPRWLPAAYAAILIVYVIPRYPYIGHYSWFSNPLKNLTAKASLKVASHPSDGRAFSLLVDRGLTVSVWLLAMICLIMLWRRTGVPWALGILTFSSGMVLSQSYGGECIIRVFLYSLTGCSVLAATVIADALSHRENSFQVLAGIAASLVLITFAAAGLQCYFAWWPFVTITREELDESRHILATNNDTRMLMVLAPQAGWPVRPSADYVRFALLDSTYDRPLNDMNTDLLNGPPKPADLDKLEKVAKSNRGAIYIVLPRRIYAYDEYFGVFKQGTIPGLIDSLSHRRGWVKRIDDSDLMEFEYKIHPRSSAQETKSR
jgi:hypothetical protein